MRKLAKDESFLWMYPIGEKRWDVIALSFGIFVILGIGKKVEKCGNMCRYRVRRTKNPERDIKRWRKQAGN
jgi:hypothetical protein